MAGVSGTGQGLDPPTLHLVVHGWFDEPAEQREQLESWRGGGSTTADVAKQLWVIASAAEGSLVVKFDENDPGDDRGRRSAGGGGVGGSSGGDRAAITRGSWSLTILSVGASDRRFGDLVGRSG